MQSFALLALLLMGGFAIAGPSGLLAWSENLRLRDQRERGGAESLVHRRHLGAMSRLRRILGTLLLASCATIPAGCATIPEGRYGVEELHFEGVEAFEPQAIAACLATKKRDNTSIRLGMQGEPSCGEPPFDTDPPDLDLWTWPWTTWPLYDRVTFEQDLARIERWYEARGHHHARVLGVDYEPLDAEASDAVPPRDDDPVCDSEDDEGCPLGITITVEEGPPTLVETVDVRGWEELPVDLREDLQDAVALAAGDRFDEALLDQTANALREELARAGYARADVEHLARVDRDRRVATIEVVIEPGPVCRFGDVRVDGADGLNVDAIKAAAQIERDERYSLEIIEDAQRAVYGLGSFSAVLVEPLVPEMGSVVDVRIEVSRAPRHDFGFGVGMQGGVERRQGAAIDVPRWDIHGVARYTNRRLFGGLRTLRIEEQPRLIIQKTFPQFERPRFGNRLDVDFRQSGFLEARTALVSQTTWDYGPDPFDLFFRHDLDSRLALERFFFGQRLFISSGVRENVLVATDRQRDQVDDIFIEIPTNYYTTFLEQRIRVDLRDDPKRPYRGAHFSIEAQEAGFRWLPSKWDYIRLTPEARFYIPLPARMTLALRFGIGAMFVLRADQDLDEESAALGPRSQRLRGGGANSHRGFLPGRLGDGEDGGTRRWTGSAEIRVPITEDWGSVVFFDTGDVSREERFRFDHLQAAWGLGLRYYTVIGAIRLDVAHRIPGLQVLGDSDERVPGARPTDVSFGFVRFPGAVHITFGDSF